MAIFSFPFSLEEECEAPLCTAALTAKNQELQNDMKRLTSVFEKVQNYINLLALPSRLTLSPFAQKLSQLIRDSSMSFMKRWYNVLFLYNVSQVFGRMPCHRAAPQLSSPSWLPAYTVFTMPLKVSSTVNTVTCAHSSSLSPKNCVCNLTAVVNTFL